MAKMIDKEPKYEGEKIVWHSFSDKLPSDWVVYNTRSINGREYDFCVISPNMGLFIVEVKGWNPSGILNVIDANTIILAGKENPEDSPRGQARGYRFDLRKKIQRELGMNPLVMSFVCYPCISEDEYYAKGLNVVSEANETIFKEELSDSLKLYQKFNERYTIDKGAKHDELDTKSLALIRHHFEPNYDLKEEQQALNPGYSRLRTFKDVLNDEDAVEIAEEYFRGIKEIVFVSSGDALQKIIKELEARFIERKIRPDKQDLIIDQWNAEETAIKNSYSVFNCEIEVVSNLSTYVDEDLLIEEGALSEKDEGILRALSEQTDFNYQQYEIEHAPTDRNILITAGAGMGKTYSMVSRIAYLCNKSADAVVDIIEEYPTTIAELEEDCKIIKEKGYTPIFFSGADMWSLGPGAEVTIGADAQRMYGNVQDFINALGSNEIQWTACTETITELAFWKKMIQEGYVNETYMADTFENGQDALANGECAFYPMGSWVADNIQSKYPEKENDISAFMIPTESGENWVNLHMPYTLAVTTNCKQGMPL